MKAAGIKVLMRRQASGTEKLDPGDQPQEVSWRQESMEVLRLVGTHLPQGSKAPSGLHSWSFPAPGLVLVLSTFSFCEVL